MKNAILTVALMAATLIPVTSLSAQAPSGSAATSALGAVTLPRKVTADGQPLPAGTYQIRTTGDAPKAGVGQSPDGEIYVEFLKAGKVVGREVATVVSNTDIAEIIKDQKVAPNGVRVELLRGNDYLRVWINRGGNNYLINLPTGA